MAQIDQPILFALTPRGGSWNYRYLVPEDLNASHRDLARLVEPASSMIEQSAARETGDERNTDDEPPDHCEGDDWLCVWRRVRQTTTGRCGPELLILKDARIKNMEQATKDELTRELEKRRPVLERLVVKKVNWERDGRNLTVPSPELTCWRDKFGKRLHDAAATDPTQKTPMKTILIAVLAAGLLLAAGLTYVGFQARNGVAENGGRAANGDDPKAADSKDKFFKKLAKNQDFIHLAEPIEGPENDPKTGAARRVLTPEQAEIVVKRINKDLFKFNASETDGNSQTAAASGNGSQSDVMDDAEALFRNVLVEFYRVNFRKDLSKKSWESLVKNQSVRGRITLLYPGGAFNKCGLLTKVSDADREILKGLKPVRLAAVVSDLDTLYARIRKAKGVAESSGDRYELFLHQVKSLMERPVADRITPPDPKRPLRRFFIPADVQHAKLLKELFNKPEARDLLAGAEGTDSLAVRLAEVRVAYGKNSKSESLLSASALNDKQLDFRKDDPKHEVYVALEQFIKACSEASPAGE